MILGVAAGSIPAAMIARTRGRKFAVFSGFSCLFIASLLAVAATKLALFELFSFASFLFGIGSAFTQQLRFAAIESTNNEEDIPKVLSILMLSGVFAAFLGPEIAVTAKEWLISPHGYAGSFLLLAFFIGIAALIMLFFKEPEIKESFSQGKARPLSEIVTQPIFIISICTATIGYALNELLNDSYAVEYASHARSQFSRHKVGNSKPYCCYVPTLFIYTLVNQEGGFKRIVKTRKCYLYSCRVNRFFWPSRNALLVGINFIRYWLEFPFFNRYVIITPKL